MGKQTKPTKKTKPTNGVAVAKNGASDLVRTEWMRRVEAEYTSAAVTQHVTLWLIQIGASPDLIHGGMRIADDEIVHAELSHEAYVEAGGAQALQLVRERLGLRRTESDPLEYDVTRVALNTFCLGETVAVPLFTEYLLAFEVTSVLLLAAVVGAVVLGRKRNEGDGRATAAQSRRLEEGAHAR